MEYLSEHAMEMILIFDEYGKIVEGNQSAREELGYEEGFFQVGIDEIFHEEISHFLDFSYLDETEEETVMYRRNDTFFPVLRRMGKMEKGKEIFGVCMALNIGIQKEAIRKLAKERENSKVADKVRNQFVANVTHELRTPVNGIRGHAKNLESMNLTREQKQAVKIIETCCVNMGKIIDNLLDFSKLESGKFVLVEKPFEFREMLDSVLALNVAGIEDKGLRLLVSVSSEVPEHLLGDELCIGQIFNNFLSNAKKFTEEGQIMVDVAVASRTLTEVELLCMVIDSGIGMTEMEKTKLFKSFTQTDASITRKYGGTGLGLSISKQLVELMGGYVRVKSLKGMGTTFSFSLKLKINQGETTGGHPGFPSEPFYYDGNTRLELDKLTRKEAKNLGLSGEGIQEIMNPVYPAEERKESRRSVIWNHLDRMIKHMEEDDWQKVEQRLDTIKHILSDETPEIRRQMLRMEMAARKEDYEKTMVEYEKLAAMMQEEE